DRRAVVATRFPEARCRIAGACRRRRVHTAAAREDRAIRGGAGAADVRETGVLRERACARRLRERDARRDAHGTTDKAEGNPLHPASLGATDIFSQASILDLYDPERSKLLRSGNDVGTWPLFVSTLHERVRARNGDGLHLLTQTV